MYRVKGNMKSFIQISLCVVVLLVYSNGDEVPPSFQAKLHQHLQRSRWFWNLTGSHIKTVHPVSFKVDVVSTYKVTKMSNEFISKGNDALHLLTKNGKHELRVDLQRFNGQKGFAKYSSFAIGEEGSKYKLSVSGHSGIGDSLIHHSGMRFTTKDQDNDLYSSNCAVLYKEGLWYKSCHHSDLNGLYAQSPIQDPKYNTWRGWFNEALKRSTMMMRPSV